MYSLESPHRSIRARRPAWPAVLDNQLRALGHDGGEEHGNDCLRSSILQAFGVHQYRIQSDSAHPWIHRFAGPDDAAFDGPVANHLLRPSHPVLLATRDAQRALLLASLDQIQVVSFGFDCNLLLVLRASVRALYRPRSRLPVRVRICPILGDIHAGTQIMGEHLPVFQLEE